MSRRVLLVEDDELLRGLTAMILRGFGHEVIVTASAEEALSVAADGEPIDVLFTDVKLGGGIDGVELARQLLTTVPSLSVILTSGDPSWLEPVGLPPAQVRLLTKPFRRDQVRAALDGPASSTTTPDPPKH